MKIELHSKFAREQVAAAAAAVVVRLESDKITKIPKRQIERPARRIGKGIRNGIRRRTKLMK